MSGPTTPLRESGWLPDHVYTGEKFESGVAFFADSLGRITRFSREASDLASARRLGGQAALPGLVNGHSQVLERLVRGRTEPRTRAERTNLQAWRDAMQRAASGLSGDDVYDAARMAFLEMLLSGITCVGEFHGLQQQPDGSPYPDPNHLAHEILRAARDTGIRIALFKVACARASSGEAEEPAFARRLTPTPESFIREMDALRAHVAREYPGDETWLGVGAHSLRTVPIAFLKTIATYAHHQRLRLQLPVAERPDDTQACLAETGRTPVQLLAEHGLLDKRFTAIHAVHISDEDARRLGAARAIVCSCPTSERNRGDGALPAGLLLDAGAAISLGTDRQIQINLLEEARRLEYHLRATRHEQGASASASAAAVALLGTATVVGARSLGAPSGALEVGRPADFFTVNLFDPSIAGTDAEALLNHIVFSLERRAIREVWIGGRQRVSNGRHAQQGPIVGRFVDLQKRIWGPAEGGAALP